MRFLFEVTSESVSSQYLKGAEKYKQAELVFKICGIHRAISLKSLAIHFSQFPAKIVGKVGLGLPEEGSNVIEHRPATSALKVDEAGRFLPDHHVAALEIAVHESTGRSLSECVGHPFEVIFQPVFLKLRPGGFQKAVFKIVQVPECTPPVEFRLRITLPEVHAFRSFKLEAGEILHRPCQKL